MMEKVLVSLSGPCLDDKDLVTLLGEFTIVASPNLENVIKKLKVRLVSNVLDIKRCSIYDFVHNNMFPIQDALKV
jgi:hypothetical protein